MFHHLMPFSLPFLSSIFSKYHLLHSAEMTGQMVDGVLQLQVTYETFVMEKQEDQDKFESYEIRTGVGGLTDGSKE